MLAPPPLRPRVVVHSVRRSTLHSRAALGQVARPSLQRVREEHGRPKLGWKAHAAEDADEEAVPT
eukprot:232222-Alexandrium_andersonii.AAC.1